jgi:hypothetical protein
MGPVQPGGRVLRLVFTPNIRVDTNNVINSVLSAALSPYLAITSLDSL